MTTHKLMIGCTLGNADISHFQPLLADNECSRVFPDGTTGLLQSVATNPVHQYLLAVGAKHVAVSTRLLRKYLPSGGGWTTGMNDTITKMKAMIDAGFDTVYYTEDHEPCETAPGMPASTAAAYKASYTNTIATGGPWDGVWARINAIGGNSTRTGLPYRSHIKAGHCQARQWIDINNSGNWATYDTGLGDFFSCDMYGNPWAPGGVQPPEVAISFPTPATTVATFGAYKFNVSDTRDRMFFELGIVALPFDTDGSARDAWMQGIHQIVNTWDPASKGWNFTGWIWWGTEGAQGDALAANPGPPAEVGIGTKRYFQLDGRHTGGAPSGNGYQTLTAGNRDTLDRWNQLATYNNN